MTESEQHDIVSSIKFFLFVAKQFLTLKLSRDQLEEDFNKLNLPEKQREIFFKFIDKYGEAGKRAIFKGYGLVAPSYVGISWRIDIKIRDNLLEEIFQPLVIARIEYNPRHDSNKYLFLEMDSESLSLLIKDLQAAYENILKIEKAESRIRSAISEEKQ